MNFLEDLRNLVTIVGAKEHITLDELDRIVATWRANLDLPQRSSPSSPQEWDLIDGPSENRCFGATRTSHASELLSEPKSPTQKKSYTIP